MRNTWLCPGNPSHPLQCPPTERQRRSGRPRLPAGPSRTPEVTGRGAPPPPPPAPPQAGLPQPRLLSARGGCGGTGGNRAGPPRSPRVRSWLLAALRGAGAPGSAPAASRGRPPPGAGPAAAALRTPAARRQRQQLQPHCPSSYFSDGSSRCCLGKRFFPPARNRFPTFHQSTQTERK